MKITVLAVSLLLLLSLYAKGSQSDYVAKTKRLDNYRVIVTCDNNADPTGVSLGRNVVMITCLDARK